ALLYRRIKRVHIDVNDLARRHSPSSYSTSAPAWRAVIVVRTLGLPLTRTAIGASSADFSPVFNVAEFGFIYGLTRICFMEYINIIESLLEPIPDPNRRAILSLLMSSQQSVGNIERRLRMPQPTVSKHLRVLREAGFVESTVDAQRRLYRL